jgi:WD40 repeat protein
MTQSQAAIGTPAYMAPEQGGEAKYVGPEADVYSLGAVLYECLTGKPPFDGESAWAVIPRVLNDAPPPIRDILPTVPRDLELICLKCLEKKPEHRYRTATELADDLARFLQGKPVSVRPVNAPTRAYRWTKRNPAFAGLVALTLFLLFVIPPLFVWNQARLDRRETAAAEATARADAAKREREQAELAAQEAKNAQAAALKLADTRELFGIQNKLRALATDRDLSWTFASRAELSRAMTLIENDPSATHELRSAAVRVFLSDDLKPLEPALRGFTASAIATNPVTGEIACGESIAWVFTQCRVRIFDPRDKKSKRELSFPAGFARQPTGDVRGSPDAVRTLAFSPDGKQLYVGTRSSMVHRFDLENKAAKPATSWAASRNPVEQLAVTNTTVYGLCRPETPVLAWECETGKLLAKLESPENTPISAISLLPTGELLTCDSKHIHRWTPTFKVAHSVPNPGARRIACTATTAIIAGDGTHLDLYNSETMTQSDRFLDPALRHDSHEESLRSLAVHPSGAFIASSSGDHDRSVKVWEFASGRLVGIVHVAGTGPIAITWSSDGAVLLATASEHIARWSFHPAESQQFTCLTGNTIVASHFCHEGKQVALTDSVQGKRTALLGMPNTVSRTAPLPEPGGNGLPGFAIHPATGLIAITEGAPGIALWNGKKNISKQGFTSEIAWAPRFSYNGNSLWVVINSSHLHVYDTKTKALRHKWNGSLAGSVSGLASLDALAIGKEWAVTGGRGGSIYQLDTATCELKNTFAAPGDPVTALAITPDDELIVAGTQKGKVRFVKTTTREELPPLAGHTGGTTAVAVSHNGALLATGGRDRKVRLWKRREHQFEPLFTLNDLPEHVRELHFCPQSNQLLVLLINEHAVRVWNLDKLQTQLNEFRLGW